ncbi:hypothetical protein NDI52_28930 [Leptolyngbya sp. PL-A3]|uniref:hypothetical protein n=1 Tax=Leptolyngbya sp. PL-A3 TaxID=2933911 RepID=UPI003296CC61
MENQSTSSTQRPLTLKTLLPTIFSAFSVVTASWVAYQNTQLTPKVDEIQSQVQQLRSQVEQANSGVSSLQQLDDARKRELFRRLTENKNNQEEVRNVFRTVFPEDEFWVEELRGNSTSGATQ